MIVPQLSTDYVSRNDHLRGRSKSEQSFYLGSESDGSSDSLVEPSPPRNPAGWSPPGNHEICDTSRDAIESLPYASPYSIVDEKKPDDVGKPQDNSNVPKRGSLESNRFDIIIDNASPSQRMDFLEESLDDGIDRYLL